MAIVPTWDEVYINVYNFSGVNPSYPIEPLINTGLARGVVDYIGPNVDRVSEGQLVVFKTSGNSSIIKDQSNQWTVVSQQAVLTIFTADA